MPARLLTTGAAAEVLAVTPATVRKWARAGRLVGVQLGVGKGGDWRIPSAELAAFIAKSRRP